MFQKVYQSRAGKASLNIKKATAGAKINCRLTYRVGSLGIDDSGSMKVLFRIVTDCAEPQFDASGADNYVKFSSSNKRVKINVGLRSGGLYGKIHPRPWSKGFVFNFSENYLAKGDEIYIDFKKWRVQTFCEKTFEFKVLVDPFATAKYIELPSSPTMKIVPDKPHRLVAVVPTKVEVGKPFKFLIKIEDSWGNPCTNKNGLFSIEPNSDVKSLPKNIKFKQGRAELKASIDSETTTYIRAKYKDLLAISNSITAVKKAKYWQFWAELHGQSEETVGTNDVNDWFEFAKKYALVDVASHQGNDFQVTRRFWKKINQATKHFNKNDEFITFPGYEWTDNTSKGGDRNVLYLEEGLAIHKSSHALIDHFDDLDSDAKTANELFQKVPSEKTIIFAHVGGRFADLSMHDDELERNIEIHSCWGTFEWFLFEALKRGYRVGIVANSDGHTGRPGASYPSFTHFNSYGGLTCILAENLDRKSVFDALYARHCYATTGARIFLDARCLINEKYTGIMGDVVKAKGKPTLKIEYRGTSPLDRMEIFNKNKIIYTYFPEIKERDGKTIKVVWLGSKVRGRKRSFAWQGQLRLENNSIRTIRKINFFSQKSLLTHAKKSASWQGNTTGGLQGLVIDLTKKAGKLYLEINRKKISLPIGEINQRPKSYSMGGLDAKVEIYQAQFSNKSGQMELEYKPKKLDKGNNPIFVKIIQKDGHLAWSSPIYFIE